MIFRHVQVEVKKKKKIRMCIRHVPKKSQFSSVFLHDALFPKLWPYFEIKCTEWPQNDLNMFKVERSHVHARWENWCPICSIRSAANSPFLRKVVTCTMFKIGTIPYAVICMLRGPNFLRFFFSTMSHFRVPAHFWEKTHWMTPNDLDISKVISTDMHTA